MPTLSSPPQVVFFDLDDTLLDQRGAERIGALHLREAYQLHHWEPGSFLQRWNELLHEHFAPYLAGTITFQEHRRRRIRAMFENTSIPDDEADAIFKTYSQSYEGNWALFTDAAPCLEALRGVRLGIISNGNGDQQRRKLKITGIDQRFETLVLSGECAMAKPDPRIFEEACRRLNVTPADCVMVGDNWKLDILGAHTVGMPGIWLCRNGKTSTEQPGITSLNELPAQWGA